MDISEMHVWFRQYAQQMGMQNVRTILDEQIDILLNTSITDTINKIIQRNISVTNDKVDLTNTKIGQINAFTDLYQFEEISVSTRFVVEGRFRNYTVNVFSDDYYLITKFALNYKNSDNSFTNYFKLRLIDEPKIDETLQDTILTSKINSPVCCVANNKVYIYLPNDIEELHIAPSKLKISYIAKPNKVKLDLEDPTNNVDCNLPEYLHADIVKHASNLYISTLFGPRGGRPYPFEENNNNFNNQ